MKEFRCNVAQKGFFAGPVFYIRPVSDNNRGAFADAESETEKLLKAAETLKSNIRQKQMPGKNAEIQETVLSFLEDDAFLGKAEQNIRVLKLSAAKAAAKAAEDLAKEMNSINSEYIRSRQDDIRGVANQLLSVLHGNTAVPEKCSAICAPEISPALLCSMEEFLIGGMLTEKGSPNSHTSILAGNNGIPYLYGNREAVIEAQRADFIIIDSETKTVITDPEEEVKNAALGRMEKIASERTIREFDQETPLIQTETRIYANIEGPQDVDELLKSGADGVGLFRTEFLFLDRNSAPTEEEQIAAYSCILEAMGEKEVIIRTMDIGSDKKASWMEFPDEYNPALGLRGVRVSLERKELFHTQLRALLRAGIKGNLKIMFPMIASSWEISEAKERVLEAASELRKQGMDYRIPPIGIMVETPAAAICAEELAKKADFFSIGTNDLTQYTIALDREAQGLSRYFCPRHEAVFRLIGMTADGGHKQGIETGVCGQLAADPESMKRLIGLGVSELSVPVRKVKATRILAAEAENQIRTEAPAAKMEIFPGISSPADGRLIPMADIPDPVFAGGVMGECFGILPSNGNVYSPVTGTVIDIAEAGHALTIRAENERNILVHVGINTVKLGPKAFIHHVRVGEQVEKDQLLMDADLEMIKNAKLSPMIIVIALR